MPSTQGSTEYDRAVPIVTTGLPLDTLSSQGRHIPSFRALARGVLGHIDQQIGELDLEYSGDKDHGTIDSEKLKDVRTRFLLWCGNLGVMHEPDDPRSLDSRLLGAVHVANRVNEVLEGLKDLLTQSRTPFGCDPSTESAFPANIPQGDEDAMMMQLLGLQTSTKCTISWLSASLDDTLRRLFHLSSLITKSSTRDKFARAEVKCKLQMYETYDVQHVHEKVRHAGGRAGDALIKRLGKANTNRRHFIKYSRSHATELGHEIEGHRSSLDEASTHLTYDEVGGDSRSDGRSLGQSERTKRSEAPTKASTIGLIDPDAFDYGLDDAQSTTTVATSIVDGQAFSGLKVPDLTQYTIPGEHFICPICHTVQHFNGQMSWRRHVFSDIRAYICTSTKCGMLMFSSFNAWRSHEMDHRREWLCPVCNLVCHDRSKAQMHLSHHHPEFAERHDIDILLQAISRSSENLPAGECPFCDWATTLRERNQMALECELTVPSRRFMKHLGRHLEEFALFVVPQPEEDQENLEDIGSNAVHCAQGASCSIASTLSSFRSRPPSLASTPSEADSTLAHRSNRGICPYPTCGRHFKDLRAHMIEHRDRRPWKCPIVDCEYHTIGFEHEYQDRSHRLIKHYRGVMVCRFCPGAGTSAEKSYKRMDDLKRHLVSSHGARNGEASTKSPSLNNISANAAICSTCNNTFADARDFYNHLDDCVHVLIGWGNREKEIDGQKHLTKALSDAEDLFHSAAGGFDMNQELSEPAASSRTTTQHLEFRTFAGDTVDELQSVVSPPSRWQKPIQSQRQNSFNTLLPSLSGEEAGRVLPSLSTQEEVQFVVKSPKKLTRIHDPYDNPEDQVYSAVHPQEADSPIPDPLLDPTAYAKAMALPPLEHHLPSTSIQDTQKSPSIQQLTGSLMELANAASEEAQLSSIKGKPHKGATC